MNEKIGKIKLELLKEEFIKQIKDSYTLNLSMVLLEEFENLQQENKQLKDNWKKLEDWIKVKDNNGFEKIYLEDIIIKMQDLQEGGGSNE